MTGTDYKTLLDAIRDLILSDSDEEVNQVIAANPILLQPRTLAVMRDIILSFQQKISVVDEIPEHWLKRVKILESYKNPPKVHESEV